MYVVEKDLMNIKIRHINIEEHFIRRRVNKKKSSFFFFNLQSAMRLREKNQPLFVHPPEQKSYIR